MKTLYMNNSGSQWKNYFDDGTTESHEWETKSGKKIVRKPKFWESFGNFALAHIRYKGKTIRVFPDELLDD